MRRTKQEIIKDLREEVKSLKEELRSLKSDIKKANTCSCGLEKKGYACGDELMKCPVHWKPSEKKGGFSNVDLP